MTDERTEAALRREVRRRMTAERIVRKQAAALTKIRSLLVREHALPDFVSALLETITRECGGLWCTLWRRPREVDVMRRTSISWCDVSTREAVERFVERHRKAMRDLSRLYEELLLDHRATLVIDAEEPRVPSVIRRFYKRMGVGVAVVVPLLFDDRLLGWVVYLAREKRNRLGRDTVAFIEAASQQATIAIHLAMLSEAERARKDAEERERRARERERDAQEINSLLQLSGAGPRTAEEIVRSAFTNAVKLLHGKTAILWTWDPDSEEARPLWRHSRNRTLRISERQQEELADALQGRARRIFHEWTRTPDARSRVLDKPADDSLRGTLLGRRPARDDVLHMVPLRLGEECLGLMLVASEEKGDPGMRRAVAVRALAMQAALALQLDALSASERSASIAGERTRIARDLHDLLAQSFSGISLQVEAVRAATPDLPAVVVHRLENIREQASRSMRDLRRTLLLLRPALLDERPLADALRELAEAATPRRGWTVRYEDHSDGLEIDSKAEVHLYAIASEALQNALTHSRPGTIRMTLSRVRNRLRLVVESPGRLAASSTRPGHGLANMRERAAAIRGTFSIREVRGRVRVEATVPGVR